MCLFIVPVIVFIIPDMVTATPKTRKIVKVKEKHELSNKIRHLQKHRLSVKSLVTSYDTSTAVSTVIFDGMLKILNYDSVKCIFTMYLLYWFLLILGLESGRSNAQRFTTESDLYRIRKHRMKPLRRQIHPHPHFREKDRLMYPLHRSHPSPHHLNPIFTESFYPNLTSSDYKKANDHGINNKDGSRFINVSTMKAVNKKRFASFTMHQNDLTRPPDTLLHNLKILLE